MTSITQRVAQLVEDKTRFAASDIATLVPQQDHQAVADLFTTETVTYQVQSSQGTGALPPNIQAYPSAAQAQQAIHAQQQRAEAEAPELLAQWAQGEGQNYRRYLPPAQGFLTAPQAVGAQMPCTTCTGAGTTTCSQCNGRKRSTCSQCSGSGQCDCSTCRGTGMRNCQSCSGTMYVRCHSCNGGSMAMPRPYSGGGQTGCGSCGGSGKSFCMQCNAGKLGCNCWGGKVSCSPCSGQGHITCNGCHGAGVCTCRPCDGTGTRHEIWQVVCEVNQQLQTRLEDGVPQALQALITGSADSLGTLQHGPHPYQVQGMQYTVQHRFAVPWSEVQLRVQARDYHLLGVGADAQVHDFHNMVSDLLQGDLAALQAASQGVGHFAKTPAALTEQLQRFATSEMNLAIVDALAEGTSNAQVARQSEGAVDADYVAASKAALANSFRHLLNPRMLKTTGILALVSMVMSAVLAVMMVFDMASLYLRPLCYSLATVLALWCLSEWWQRRQIAALFAPASRGRITQYLRRGRGTYTWRITGAITLSLAALLGSVVVAQLPWTQNKQAELALLEQQYPFVRSWMDMSTWRYNTYPDVEWMQRFSTSTLPEQPEVAMTYATWQLLHGGNAAQARETLTLVPTSAQNTSLWHTITALVEMASTDPAQQAAGRKRLHQAADLGSAEAQWRLYQHYARSDASQALAFLALAAERGQQEALLDLGQRYMKGHGVPKDLQRAQGLLGGMFMSKVPGGAEASNEVDKALMQAAADEVLQKHRKK